MNKFIAILTICLMFSLTGCQTTTTNTGSVAPFIGGNSGLKLSFVDGAPPDQIYDMGSSAFAIGIKVDNVGEYSLEPNEGYVEIIGINPQDFNKGAQTDLRKSLEDGLRGAKKNLGGSALEGDSSVAEFADLKYLPDLKGNTDFKFRANLCYDYVTQTSTKICINRNPLGGVGEAICKVSGEKSPQNSGGPIHITKMKEIPLGNNKVQLLFEVGHTGDKLGLFYKPGTECNDAITNQDKYKVYLTVTSDINGVKPKCTGLEMASVDESEGYVTLFGGKNRAVTCTLDLSHVDSVFEELFSVELRYRYHQYLDKNIEIQDVSCD